MTTQDHLLLYVLTSNGTTASWAAPSFSGTLGISQGGTGQTTQTAAFDALSPLTTQGDILYYNGTHNVRLGPGTAGQVLQSGGAGANPSWITATGTGTVTSVSVTSANGLAGSVATSTTTPAITFSTNVNGMVKGNGTAFSAATSGTDYAPGTSSLGTGILKSTTSTGALSIAVAADFPTLNQNTTGS